MNIDKKTTEDFFNFADFSLFEGFNQLAVLIESTGKIIYANQYFLDFTEYSLVEVQGENWIQFFIPESGYYDVKSLFKALNSGSVDLYNTTERRILTKSNKEKIIRFKNTFFRDKTGKIVYFIAVGEEIAQLERKIKDQIQLSQLRQIFDNLDAMIYICDPQTYEILFTNRKLNEMFKNDPVGKTCYKFLQNKDNPCEFCTNKIILENPGVSYVWEHYNPLLDRTYLLHDQIIEWVDGRSVRFEHTVDITDKKKMELEREEFLSELSILNKKLLESNTNLAQFAYVASHDLQEPLRMVTSYLQLLRRRYRNKLDKDADEFIDFAVDGASRMKILINDLLTYSRLETRKKPFEPTDLNVILTNVLTSFQERIQTLNAKITYPTLPIVYAEAIQMEQLFQNLIGNALKFHSDKPIEISIQFSENDSEYQFAVQDNGIGIEPRFYEKIFEIFQRLHNREDYEGTGIGLAVCKKIIDIHNGKIWVESAVGKGTTFYFTLLKSDLLTFEIKKK